MKNNVILTAILAYRIFIITMTVVSALILALFYNILKPQRVLPIYQPAQVNAALVDTAIQYKKKYHKIADFALVNQNGDSITQADYNGKIYVADFFFTTCQTICPIMTDHMYQIQQQTLSDPDVMLLSHSVTPEIDSVTQLQRYALKKGVLASKWNLVTGDKKQIYDLARSSYLAVKTTADAGSHEMIHTENFMLIDQKKQIRGFYDGTDPKAIETLLDDIKVLKASFNE
ncbi:MAG: SCO family protein [Bacteroidota bacterium]|nr:SCO family protein [Bacteroidota bacterium]